jgi:hypothetical protein
MTGQSKTLSLTGSVLDHFFAELNPALQRAVEIDCSVRGARQDLIRARHTINSSNTSALATHSVTRIVVHK